MSAKKAKKARDVTDKVLVKFSTRQAIAINEKRTRQYFPKSMTIGQLQLRVLKELDLDPSHPIVCSPNCVIFHTSKLSFKILLVQELFAPAPSTTLEQMSAV